MIRIFSAPGDLVLDCFVGSGTTTVAAISQRRNYLGIELMPRYAELARKRCRNVQLPIG